MSQSRAARAAALSDFAAAQVASLPGLGDIEQLITAADVPPAAILSGLRSVMAERQGIDTSPDPAGVADLLHWLLKQRTGPFTALAEALTGCPARVDPFDPGGTWRTLTAAEAGMLGTDPASPAACWERTGLLSAGTTIAAEVRLVLVPALAGDDEAVELIRKGAPCGAVLPGLTRLLRTARCWPADPPVTASAVLHTRGTAFGFAGERVTAGLVSRVAELIPS